MHRWLALALLLSLTASGSARADEPLALRASWAGNLDFFSTGAALARCGVISGRDMTPEAALTKLYCLLAAGLSPAQVRARMQEDLAGELEPD